MKPVEFIHEAVKLQLGKYGQVVVAGGAVRDHLMGREPKDIDVFILGNRYINTIAKEIQEILHLYPVVKNLEWHNSEPYLVTTIKLYGYDVQIMLNPAETPHDLINTFDWNVCLFAFDGNRFYAHEGIGNIAPGKPLRLNKVTFPLSTLRRGYRFSERFGMEFTLEDQYRLIKEVAERKQLIGPSGATPDMPSLEANTLID